MGHTDALRKSGAEEQEEFYSIKIQMSDLSTSKVVEDSGLLIRHTNLAAKFYFEMIQILTIKVMLICNAVTLLYKLNLGWLLICLILNIHPPKGDYAVLVWDKFYKTNFLPGYLVFSATLPRVTLLGLCVLVFVLACSVRRGTSIYTGVCRIHSICHR